MYATLFIVYKGKSMNKSKRKNKKKKSDFKGRIIKRQIDEINDLKNTISKLEIGHAEKDKIISSIDVLRNDLIETVDDLKAKGEEYDKLIAELREMKKAMNEVVFKKRWKIIKLLLK